MRGLHFIVKSETAFSTPSRRLWEPQHVEDGETV